jgi:hypothetical protein
MERPDATGIRPLRRLCLEWQRLPQPLTGRFRDYWHALERAAILRVALLRQRTIIWWFVRLSLYIREKQLDANQIRFLTT